MSKKFAVTLTKGQLEMARRFEAAGLTTYSQAVKAFERNETARISEWKRQLAEKEQNS